MPDLESVLQSFRKKADSGPDGITYEALTKSVSKTITLLLERYNNMWQEECHPTNWKLAKIAHLLKSGMHPISLNSLESVT